MGLRYVLQIWVLFLCPCIFTFNKNIYGQISTCFHFIFSLMEKSISQLCFARGQRLVAEELPYVS